MSNSVENENKTTTEHAKKKKPQPGFMSMRWLRLHNKRIIIAVIVTFLISLFFIGYGTSKQNANREEKQRAMEAKEAQEAAVQNALPEKLQAKANMPAVFVSYNNGNASYTTSIDVKTLWRYIKNTNDYSRLQQMPEGFKQYYMSFLKEGAIENLIKTNLLELYAKANNIVAPVTAAQIIENDKRQFGSSHEFTRNLIKSGLTEDEYGQERLKQITISAVQQIAVTQTSPASATEDYLKSYYETHKNSFKKDDEVTFEHLLVSPSAFESKKEFTDEEINSYYEANKNSFLSSKRAEVSHIYINSNSADYINESPVNESELLATYNENKSRFTEQEQVKASHILIKPRGEGDDSEKKFEEAKNVIQAIYERAKNGEDFAKLASENSEDEGSATKGGDLGFFGRGMMVKPFEEAAFSAEVGSITEPVRSQFGYHIIKVEAKTPEKVKTFEEVKEQLTKEAKAKFADIKASSTLESLRMKLVNGEETFAKAVKDNSRGRSSKNNGKLPVFFKGELTEDYTAEDKEILKEEICDGYNFIASEIENQIFALGKDEISEVIKTQNGYHLFKLESFLEPVTLKLTDNVKSKIKDILADKEKAEEAAKSAEKLVKENASADIDALVKAYGQEKGEVQHSFENYPFSNNPGMSYQELSVGMGLFSDNGRIYLPEFHKAVMDAVKANKLNEYLPPFKSVLGWHIVKVKSYKADQYDSFENCRDTIRRIVTFEPSDAEVNKYYEETKSQYDQPATRTIRQIVCDKDTAEKVYKELNEGAGFSMLARSYSTDSSSTNGGLMSPMPKGKYSAALDEAIWNLNMNEYTKPIETSYGWVIAKLESQTEEVKGNLDASVISRIKRVLRDNNRNEAWSYFLKGIMNQAYVVRNQEIIDLVE